MEDEEERSLCKSRRGETGLCDESIIPPGLERLTTAYPGTKSSSNATLQYIKWPRQTSKRATETTLKPSCTQRDHSGRLTAIGRRKQDRFDMSRMTTGGKSPGDKTKRGEGPPS